MDQPPERPARSRLPYVALQERAGRARDRLRRAPDRLRRAPDLLRGWDAGHRATSFVPSSETVELDVRRHPVTLAWPAARTAAGLLVLLAGPGLPAVLAFLAVTALWSQTRLGGGLRRAAVVAAAGLLVLLVAATPLALLVLGLWLAEDVADWRCDRLIVTNKRIYRRYGVFTAHSPSIALTAVAFIDASVPPIGRLLHYGTLHLDSVAQRDAPLARLDLLPDITRVSHEILRLRAAALQFGR